VAAAPTQGGGTNTPGTKSPVAQKADSADDAKVGGIKTQAIWIVGGFLGLIALSVGGFFIHKSGIVHRVIGWMLMHTGLSAKYRYYQVGAVAVYSANYLDPAAEAAWFEAADGFTATDYEDNTSQLEEAPVAYIPEEYDATSGVEEAGLDTVYNPESALPEMPVMEIGQPKQLISEDMPVPDPSLPSLLSLQERRRRGALSVPKRHKHFSTLITRNQ
jgi:hypothetical protein